MAIGAPDSFVIHLALDEGPIDIDFVLDLPVIEVGFFLKQFELEMITELIACMKVCVQ